ncbi:MAG TPA: hypothetical protein VIV11_08555 [Kofleriaceae bacterium]
MKSVALGCVVIAGLVAIARPVVAQPTAPAPPNPTPTPNPAPNPTPNQPTPDVPAPNPDAPPPGTEPAPAPRTTATPPSPAPANGNGNGDKKTATEQRLAAAAACHARSPDCDWMMTFSSLEKLSIRRSLAELALEIEPAPWDKVIGTIRVINEDVFAEANWLRFFNIFHITTREATIRGELTIAEGQVWNEELIAESARRLKDPLYTGVVALLPTKSAEEGKVDLLVVTRDIWSLRLNTQYQVQQGSLTNLSISLSENNFLGRRKTIALGFLVDQGAITTGPLFIDKNFLGQHMDFRFRIDRIFTRKSLDVIGEQPPGSGMLVEQPTGDPGGLQDDRKFRAEGSQATVALTKTLWSLASKWGGGGSFTYRNAINRSYRGTGLRAVDDPATPDNDFLPRQYRMRSWSVRGSVTRQWGDEYKHQIEGGHSVTSQTPSLVSNFTSDPALRAFFVETVFPRDELISSPFIEYSIFRASFRTIRNVDTFDLAEDLRLGPNLTAGLQQSLAFLGSDVYFTRPSLVVGWTFPWTRDGFVRLAAGGQIRIQAGQPTSTIDNTATGSVRVATPTFGYFRVVTQAHFETRWNDTQNAFYTLGSESGLRGYDLGQFIGNRRVVGQIEARSVPVPFWVLRLGAVAFYEVGGVAVSFNEMELHHDVGVGFRMLIPQTARDLFRFDIAKPLDGEHRCPIPGNICFIAGFDSYF